MTSSACDAPAEPGQRAPFSSPGPPPRAPARVDSVVVVNPDDGEAKSTAAFGVMIRGWQVGMVQLLKSGDEGRAERLAEHLGVHWWTLVDGFTWESNDLDESAAKNVDAWSVGRANLASGTTSSWCSTSSINS